MNSEKHKLMIAAALAGVAADPVLSHMRKVAYSPVTPKENNSEEALKKAEEKRLRKQERNKKNGQS